MIQKIRALEHNGHKSRQKKESDFKSQFDEQYDYKKLLGKGAFGIVMSAEKKLTKNMVAIKRVKLNVNPQVSEMIQQFDVVDIAKVQCMGDDPSLLCAPLKRL